MEYILTILSDIKINMRVDLDQKKVCINGVSITESIITKFYCSYLRCSMAEVLFSPVFVCLFVHLYLLRINHSVMAWIFLTFGEWHGYGTLKSCLNFGRLGLGSAYLMLVQ